MLKTGIQAFASLSLLLAIAPEAWAQEGASSLESLLATPVSAAALYAQTSAEAPGAVTIVTAEDIRRFGWTTLEDVLGWVHGFHTTNDRNYSYIGVRGFSLPTDYNNRLLLLVDGHPVNDAFYGSAPAGNDLGVDLTRVERIEVVRGAGSALYGSNAMFAVVNVVTTKSEEAGWAHVRGGSWNTLEAGAGVAATLGPVGVEVSGMYGRTDGEDVWLPEFGAVRDLDGEEHASAAIRAQWRAFELTGRLVGRSKDVPTAPYGTTPHAPTSTYDELVWLTLRIAPELGASTDLEFVASIDHYDYEGHYPTGPDLYRDMNDVNEVGITAHLRRDLRANNRLVIGAALSHAYEAKYRSWDDATVYFDDDIPYSSGSLFVQDEHDVTPELSVLAGLRYDANGLGFSHLSPRAALIWTPEAATAVKLVYGEAFRGPSVYERYYEAVDFRSGELDAEQSRMAELIVERRFGASVQASVSAYTAVIEGLIETTEDSAGIGEFRNASSARTEGIESEIQARRNGYLARLAYSFTHAHANDRRATNSPSHVVQLGLGAPLAGRADLGVLARWESNRLTVQDTRTPSFFRTDVNVRFPDVLPGLTAQLNVRNLFDAAILAPGGFEHVSDAIPQMGRRLEAALEYAF